MNKYTKIVGGILGLSLLIGVGVTVNLNEVKAGSLAQVESNKMTRGTWQIDVPAVEFSYPNATEKTAMVYLNISSIKGVDETMTPSGYIAGVVGSSGKVYDIMTIDASKHVDRELGKQTIDRDKKAVPAPGKTYEPGLLKEAFMVRVDVAEESISAVIYQDENGNKVNIPVTIKPTFKEADLNAK